MCYNGAMIYLTDCSALSAALEKLKEIVKHNEKNNLRTIIFCEDRLSLAAERTVCAAVEGSFLTSVYTFARFLTARTGKCDNVLSSQGSAMAVRKIIEENRAKLNLFKKLSSSVAAQTIYDTIALLYSSRVSAEDAAAAAERGGVLGGKLHDLAIIYEAYTKFLQQSGMQDRNAYLRKLPDVIKADESFKGSTVIFLGFQAFTCTSQEIVRAVMSKAANVHGLFIGGTEDIYVNEASAFFHAAAAEFGGVERAQFNVSSNAEAEALRKGIFNPESFYTPKYATANVGIYEATDGEEELEFIAASIKKHVMEGERYAKISVMLPDLNNSERVLARVFSRFKIPYYADMQLPLSDHALCTFIINYLLCIASGCRFADVDGVIASPYFPAERADKDEYRNYALKYATYRGGIKRAPNSENLEKSGFDFERVERVRALFLKGLEFLTVKGGNRAICMGLRSLLEHFEVKQTLEKAEKKYKNQRPCAAEFSHRALESALAVISEAESIAADDMSVSDFIKILKSGFAAMKISLIPPKSDAVFVGDLTSTANTGSNVVFAARLTGDVPDSSDDTSLLTDREIAALESVNLNISPKIRQVNARNREICALNICAFRNKLYLSYSSDGSESGVSEIISYAKAIFSTLGGSELLPVSVSRIAQNARAVPYYCTEKLTALRHLRKYPQSNSASSIYAVLQNSGYKSEADCALETPEKSGISCGNELYLGKFNSLSPTTLESYFTCPYMSFISKGLKVLEREEGAMRAVDTGNFIHAVLQDLAKEVENVDDLSAFEVKARNLANEKLPRPPYSALSDTDGGKYVCNELVDEAVKISSGMYQQLKNSSFVFSEAERAGEINLSDGIKVYGRIDRVDESGDMVRVIDYKTGSIDAAASSYYSGKKLQLPLYLLAVSEGKRAVGAYYFPASVLYSDKSDGVFRLQGFMDCSDEVVGASDKNVQPKTKSSYVNANYQGKQLENTLMRDDFIDFLEYSRLISNSAVKEMTSGNITPSPIDGACEYCKMGGSCGVTLGKDVEERKTASVKCAEIAKIVQKQRKNNGEDDENATHF